MKRFEDYSAAWHRRGCRDVSVCLAARPRRESRMGPDPQTSSRWTRSTWSRPSCPEGAEGKDIHIDIVDGTLRLHGERKARRRNKLVQDAAHGVLLRRIRMQLRPPQDEACGEDHRGVEGWWCEGGAANGLGEGGKSGPGCRRGSTGLMDRATGGRCCGDLFAPRRRQAAVRIPLVWVKLRRA